MDADGSSPRSPVLARPGVRLTLGLLLPLLLALYQMWQFHGYIVDDAFISFRYARNLIEGHGLVYNIGERVEGYTNFSWTLLIAGALAAGVDPEWFTAVLGAAFGLGTIVLAYRLAERLLPASPVPCLATWLLATSPGTVGHAVFGLETSMFAFLVIAGISMFVREEAQQRRWPWSGSIFALAGLTRPEAPLFLGMMMLFLAGRPILAVSPLARLGRRVFGGEEHDWRGPALFMGIVATSLGVNLVQRDYGHNQTSLVMSGALLLAGAVLVVLTIPRSLFARRNLVRIQMFVVPIAIHVMWRLEYYGRWLPNTLTAKTGDGRTQFSAGVRYFDYYIGDVEGPLVWVIFAVCGLAVAKREPIRLAFASIVVAFCSYVMLVGGDWMLLGRYFAPVLPVFYLLVDFTARELLAMRRGAMWCVLLTVPFVIYHRASVLEDSHRDIANERDYWIERAGDTAQWFVDQERKHGEAVRGTIAMGDIGRVGWVTDYPVFDVLGLVDPITAQANGGHRRRVGKDFLDHFYGSAPRYYVSGTTTGRCHEPGPDVFKAIQRDPRFAATYQLRARIHGEARKKLSWCIYELLSH